LIEKQLFWVRVLALLLLSKKPFTDDVERFLSIIRFDFREKLKNLLFELEK